MSLKQHSRYSARGQLSSNDQNPQVSSFNSSQLSHFAKGSLAMKRQLIQQELQQIIAKVNQYQLHHKMEQKQPKNIQKRRRLNTKSDSRMPTLQQIITSTTEINQVPTKDQSLSKILSNQQLRPRPNCKLSSQRLHTRLGNVNPIKLKPNDPVRTQPRQQKYTNYLPDVDFRVPLPGKSPNLERKKERLRNHIEKALQLQKQAIKKIASIKKQQSKLAYNEYLALESQIDDIFIQALKARLRCMQEM